MIELRTGLPRNGKTLSMVHELAIMQKQWDKVSANDDAPPKGRAVYTNIKGLVLPHLPIPVKSEKRSREGAVTYIIDWDLIEDGALVIIDEAQEWFPPRSSQSEAPGHVAFLSVHGHRGLDIVFITQHPKLIDGAIRALCGKHKHYRRVLGWNKAAVYEWDGCSDNLQGMKNAVVSAFHYPADSYKYYQSATLHTKQSFKYPKWLIIPVVGIVMSFYFVPRAYTIVTKGPVSASAAAEKKEAVKPAAAPDVFKPQPVVNAVPSQVPVKQEVVAEVKPSFVGCIANASRVVCLRSDGSTVENPEGGRESSEVVGKLVPAAMSHAVAAPPVKSQPADRKAS